MAKCLYKNIFTCLIITFFAFNNAAFSQNQWRFYNSDDKVTGNPIQLDRLMDKIHVNSKKNSVGSVCLVRESKEKFSDKILMMPSGFMIFIYKADDGFIYWITAKANSEAWLSFIKSIVPDDAKKPIGSTSKRKQLTTQEQEALNILMDEVKGLYCRVKDSLIEKLIENMSFDKGIDFDELKRLSEIDKTKRIAEYRLQRYENGQPNYLRMVVQQNHLLLVDPEDGFVFFEVLPIVKEYYLNYKKVTEDRKGFDIQNKYKGKYGIVVINPNNEKTKVADLVPSEIILSEYTKKMYGIKKYNKQDADEIKGTQMINTSIPFNLLYSCPLVLSYNESFPGLDKLNVNTYLIDGHGASSLNDWYLFIDKGECNRCDGVAASHEAEIYSPFSKLSVKISNTFNMEQLTSLEYSEEKANLLKSLKLAFKLAADNRILNNKIEYLGEGGLVYRNQNGKMTITVGETTMTYNDKDIPLDEYNEWLRYFDRQKRKVNQMTPKEIVNRTFKAAAMGKENWFKEYRQSPLAFIAKYCVSSPTFK